MVFSPLRVLGLAGSEFPAFGLWGLGVSSFALQSSETSIWEYGYSLVKACWSEATAATPPALLVFRSFGF